MRITFNLNLEDVRETAWRHRDAVQYGSLNGRQAA